MIKSKKKYILTSVITLLLLILVLSIAYTKNNYSERFNEQWALQNYGQKIKDVRGKNGIDVNVIKVWDKTKGSKAILVGILDTGIQITNQTISKNIYINSQEKANNIDDDGNGLVDDINGWDFYNGDATVYDDYLYDYHGTFLASIISSSHSSAIAGIAPEITIVPLKFMNGSSGDINDAIKAIEYAHTLGVSIINCSWDSTVYNSKLADTMEKYSDILFVCSAGKYGNSLSKVPVFPACFDLENVICVTAIDNKGVLYKHSGYGKEVDIAAPGCSILGMYPDNDYVYSDGSSIATAYVTGIAALLKSAYPNLESKEIVTILKEGVTNSSTLIGLTATEGIIDAYKCLEIAKSRYIYE